MSLGVSVSSATTTDAADIESFVPAKPSRCFKALPRAEAMDELPHQVLEAMRLKVFEVKRVQRARCSRTALI